MTVEGVKAAVKDAERFLVAAKHLLRTEAVDSTDKMCFYGSAASGACRRTSLDLTRTLARMRKG